MKFRKFSSQNAKDLLQVIGAILIIVGISIFILFTYLYLTNNVEYNVGDLVKIEGRSNGVIEGKFIFNYENKNDYGHYYILGHTNNKNNRIQLYVYNNSVCIGMGDKHHSDCSRININEIYEFKFSWNEKENKGIYHLELSNENLELKLQNNYNINIDEQKFVQIGGNGFTEELYDKHPNKFEAWSGYLEITKLKIN